jgi:hypothetical protein
VNDATVVVFATAFSAAISSSAAALSSSSKRCAMTCLQFNPDKTAGATSDLRTHTDLINRGKVRAPVDPKLPFAALSSPPRAESLSLKRPRASLGDALAAYKHQQFIVAAAQRRFPLCCERPL